jgi:hypothetical protein
VRLTTDVLEQAKNEKTYTSTACACAGKDLPFKWTVKGDRD